MVFSPLVLIVSVVAFAIEDMAWKLFGRRQPPTDTRPSAAAASVDNPQLERPGIAGKISALRRRALAGNPANEIIVVDNGSSDGSAEFVRRNFPAVKVVALERNLGFGGGSNAGVRAAQNDIVVLLNSDMRVAPDFLAPLLEGFTDERVFAVSCQILFTDANKRREETGLTQGWWEEGGLRVRHRIDEQSPRSLSRAFTAAAVLAPSTGGNFWSWAASIRYSRRFISRIPISVIKPGSAAGRCCISRAASCITSIAAPSASDSPKRRSERPEKELHSFRVEEHSRVAADGVTFLLHLCGRAGQRGIRRFSAAGEHERSRAGVSAIAGRDAFAVAGAAASPWSAIPKRFAVRWAGISAIASRRSIPIPTGCACYSYRPTRSARRSTEAGYSCMERCASWRSWRKFT